MGDSECAKKTNNCNSCGYNACVAAQLVMSILFKQHISSGSLTKGFGY